LVAGAIILVAVMFLLGLDWQVWWPLFVILGGLSTLVRKPYRSRYWTRRRSGRDDAGDATLRH
jgi:membrane protein implicated in regulation of membrane protease activity